MRHIIMQEEQTTSYGVFELHDAGKRALQHRVPVGRLLGLWLDTGNLHGAAAQSCGREHHILGEHIDILGSLGKHIHILGGNTTITAERKHAAEPRRRFDDLTSGRSGFLQLLVHTTVSYNTS